MTGARWSRAEDSGSRFRFRQFRKLATPPFRTTPGPAETRHTNRSLFNRMKSPGSVDEQSMHIFYAL